MRVSSLQLLTSNELNIIIMQQRRTERQRARESPISWQGFAAKCCCPFNDVIGPRAILLADVRERWKWVGVERGTWRIVHERKKVVKEWRGTDVLCYSGRKEEKAASVLKLRDTESRQI